MPEHDHDVRTLIDQTALEAPEMHIDPEEVLAGGRSRAQRRRWTGAGMAFGAVALAGTVWLATGSGLLGAAPPPPAAPTVDERPTVDDGAVDLEDAEPTALEPAEDAAVGDVAPTEDPSRGGTGEPDPTEQAGPDDTQGVELFTGVHGVDSDGTEHSYDARLVPDERGTWLVQLWEAGSLVETIGGDAPLPGLSVFAGQAMTVAVWDEPEGVTAVPLTSPDGIDSQAYGQERRAEVDGRQVGFRYWVANAGPVPQTVRDVYFVSSQTATALSGAPMEHVVLQVDGQAMTLFADPGRQVWGLDGGGWTGTWPEGYPPQKAAHTSWGDIELSVGAYLLPTGATEIAASTAAGGSVLAEVATLAGRPVVLLVARSGEDPADLVDPQLTFLVDGQRYEFFDYPHLD